VIIYSAMDLSDRLNMKYWLHPLFDVLVALNIDVVMDVIAVRVGYWSWGIPLTGEWFGVHYGNFFGWISVTFLYSFWIRVMRKAKKTERFPRLTVFYPFFATGLSLLCLPIMGELIRQSLLSLSVLTGIGFETIQLSLLIVICSCFSISVLIDVFQHENRGFSSETVELIPASIPIFLHVFFIVLTVTIVNTQQAILLLIAVIMLVSATVVHLGPLIFHRCSCFQKMNKR
ncbi:MAG: carotenoid biosynthesis protein, partial [Candidatus Bathyarchaeota archaeon]